MIGEIHNENDEEFFEWTPSLSCLTESEAPTVEYTVQKGHGCKIKINKDISIVFIQCYIRGNITAVSSGNNYATIKGLPYEQALDHGYPSFNFNCFYKGVDSSHPLPTGFINDKIIRVQDGNIRGGSVEQWVVGNDFEIYGSGFYFTKT